MPKGATAAWAQSVTTPATLAGGEVCAPTIRSKAPHRPSHVPIARL